MATWHDDRDSAVLYVVRREVGPLDRPGDEYEDETQHLIRSDDGGWPTAGSGGGTWVHVFDPPVDLLERLVLLRIGITGTGGGSDAVRFTGASAAERWPSKREWRPGRLTADQADGAPRITVAEPPGAGKSH